MTLQLKPVLDIFLIEDDYKVISTSKCAEGSMDKKQRLKREVREYLVNFFYLLFLLGSFNWFKKLILTQHGIEYHEWGVALIEALILAKVIMIGDILHLGRWFSGRPLIVPTLYRAVVFGIWLRLFKAAEHIIRGLVHGETLAQTTSELLHTDPFEVFAITLVTVAALVPFFAFKELGKVVGEDRVADLFLRRK